MSQSLYQLLEYPREMIHAHIVLSGCSQRGVYSESSHECQQCHDRKSCKWVRELSTGTSEENQLMFLELALENMISHAAVLEHDVSSCQCNTCRWITDANESYHELLIDRDGIFDHEVVVNIFAQKNNS